MRVGLTGGIASGKSTVLNFFKACGASTVDADIVARQVVERGTVGLQRIVETFGSDFVKPDGSLDREKLGTLIFSDEKQRDVLNAIVHPLIRKEMDKQIEQLERQRPQFPVIADIPLLIENDLTDSFRRIVVVYVPEDVQLVRLMERNRLSEKEANARIKAQLPLAVKKQYADYIIDNSGSLENTKRQVEHVWHSLRRETGQAE